MVMKKMDLDQMVTKKKDLNRMVMKNKNQVEVVVTLLVVVVEDDYVLEVHLLALMCNSCLMDDDKWTFCWSGTNVYYTYLYHDDIFSYNYHNVKSCN